jgi:L-fuculose-phosphate aldolase
MRAGNKPRREEFENRLTDHIESRYGAKRMSDEASYRQSMVEIGRRLYERGYIAASDGNISVRLPDGNRFLATPSGVCKGFLTPDMLVVVDDQGRKLNGQLAPSSELAMHTTIYRLRPDVKAVVHAHPPCATGFAAAGLALDTPLVSEVVLTLGCIPLAQYGTPTTPELAEAIAPYVRYYDAMLLANHGALTCGLDLENAYFKMETVEHFARIALVARMLGQEKPLSPEAVEKLFQIRRQAGITSPTPALCWGPEYCQVPQPDTSEKISLTRQELVEIIAETVDAVTQLLSPRAADSS